MCVLKRAQAMAVNTPMMGGAKRESKTCDQETRRKLVASVPTAGEHLAQEVTTLSQSLKHVTFLAGIAARSYAYPSTLPLF